MPLNPHHAAALRDRRGAGGGGGCGERHGSRVGPHRRLPRPRAARGPGRRSGAASPPPAPQERIVTLGGLGSGQRPRRPRLGGSLEAGTARAALRPRPRPPAWIGGGPRAQEGKPLAGKTGAQEAGAAAASGLPGVSLPLRPSAAGPGDQVSKCHPRVLPPRRPRSTPPPGARPPRPPPPPGSPASRERVMPSAGAPPSGDAGLAWPEPPP